MAALIAPLRGSPQALPVFAQRVWSSWSSFRHATIFSAALAVPTLQSLIDLFPSFLLAVPKKKVSHSRKAMRSSGKGLRDKTNIVHCPACGSPKLAHHVCASCYSQISRGYKREVRERASTWESDV